MVFSAKPSGIRPKHLLILMLMLIPSAAFLWHNSDLPAFGRIDDDGIYYVSAKSLAGGHYQIESLPGQPAQTKYPPLYPALLSLAWHIDPRFPQNLAIAGWISWFSLPVLLSGFLLFYPRIGFDGWRKWLLLAAVAANPYVVLFGSKLLSELWFTALLVIALLLIEKAAENGSAGKWAVAAGAVGGLAYLMRTAGIVLLASGFLYLWMRRQRLKAFLYAAVMLPFVAAWSVWARLHQLHTADVDLIYYLDYIRYEFINVHLSNLHLVLWKNVDRLIYAFGSLVQPNVSDSLFLKITAEVLGVGMISGVVRMVRRGKAVHYAIFAAGSALMLIVWHFPPDERFVLPMAPLALAGCFTEFEHFAGMLRAGIRHRDRSQRVASGIMGAAVAIGLTFCVGLQAYVEGAVMGQDARQQRTRNVELRDAYDWLSKNVPDGETVISGHDSVVYLYTRHPAISRRVPPQIWYEEDHDRAVALFRDLPSYAGAHGAEYIYFNAADLQGELSDRDDSAVEDMLKRNSGLEAVFKMGPGTIYRVRPTAYSRVPISTGTNAAQAVGPIGGAARAGGIDR